MKKQISIPVLLLAIFVAVLLTFQCTYVALTASYNEKLAKAGLQGSNFDKLEYIHDMFEQLYVYQDEISDLTVDNFLSGDELIDAYIYATGDIYAEYYNSEEFEELMYSSAGNLVGVGVSVVYSLETKTIEILFAMDDSPAKAAGLRAGDCIVAVDSVRVADIEYTDAVNRVRGEEGTDVTLTILRTEEDGAQREFDVTLIRKAVTNQSVISYITAADPTIGVIRILEFDGATPTQFNKALEFLQTNGVTKLIFDVRGNPGGDRDSVAMVLDVLLPSGILATFEDANGRITHSVSSDANCIEMPMVVLADGNTASAGELFTCALMDYDAAVFVGTQTYGKGVAQGIYTLPDGSGMKLTTHFYNPPKSENYDGVGIEPDIKVELPEEYQNENILKIPESKDTQLAAAIAELNKEN